MKLCTLMAFALMGRLVYGQQDSTKTVNTFSGFVGVTNNGFSIIPTFSLNRPAVVTNFAWRKNRFSFNPDIRLVSDASKGGMIFWLRYQLVEQKI
jgi:hypothetical protein